MFRGVGFRVQHLRGFRFRGNLAVKFHAGVARCNLFGSGFAMRVVRAGDGQRASGLISDLTNRALKLWRV